MAYYPDPYYTLGTVAEVESSISDCREAWEGKNATWGWCIHHEMRLEPLWEPIETRIDYVTVNKPVKELEARFKNMRPVLSTLPEAVVKAGEAYLEALKAVNAAYESATNKEMNEREAEYTEAFLNFKSVIRNHREQLDAFHKADVPHHTWNGESIFEGAF